MRKLKSFDDVLEAFGGIKIVSLMTGRSVACICNWRAKRGRFPAKFYRAMSELLADQGYSAPADLWGQVELKLYKPPSLRQAA